MVIMELEAWRQLLSVGCCSMVMSWTLPAFTYPQHVPQPNSHPSVDRGQQCGVWSHRDGCCVAVKGEPLICVYLLELVLDKPVLDKLKQINASQALAFDGDIAHSCCRGHHADLPLQQAAPVLLGTQSVA
jgi:hypothetical protein